MSDAISAQGTLIHFALAATPTTFVVVGELRDITPPPLSRNPIETTNHNEIEESFVVGIRRKGELTFSIGFVMGQASHDHLTGIQKLWIDGSRDIWRVTYPSGHKWLFSGYVTNIGPSAPVDNGFTADVTVRPTGLMTISAP